MKQTPRIESIVALFHIYRWADGTVGDFSIKATHLQNCKRVNEGLYLLNIIIFLKMSCVQKISYESLQQRKTEMC